jgi:recombination protein RecA
MTTSKRASAAVSRAQDVKNQINALLKKDVLSMGSDPYYQVDYLPTGCIPVDHLLRGGVPYGRFVEFFGDYSTLKTYIALSAIVQCQKRGQVAALIDSEHSFDPDWAISLGIDVKDLILVQPPNGEEAMDAAEVLSRSGVNLIVFDSIASLLPKAEQEKSMTDPMQPARLASLMSAACRKLTAANRKTAYIWINQTRINVGQMFGTNEAVPGGKAMGYYASMRIALRKAGRQTEEIETWVTIDGRPNKKKVKLVVGQNVRATIEKSKLNQPHRETMFTWDHRNNAIDDWSFLANLALEHDIISYGNGYWWLNDAKKQKSRQSDFRGRIGLEDLKEMLTTAGVENLGGSPVPAKKKVVSPKSASSARGARGSTPTAARGASKRTVVTRKRSTK